MRAVQMFRVAAAVVLLAAGPAGAYAQQPRAFWDWRGTTSAGIGYKGNLPNALAGASAHIITPAMGGIGLYADFRTTHESHRTERFLPNVTVEQAEQQYGDEFFEQLDHWRGFNIALLRPLTAELALYAGGGYSVRTIYREYYDVTQERGEFGHYRVEDTEDSGGRVNATAGALFRAGRLIAFHFGGELAPAGFTVGASFLFPLR